MVATRRPWMEGTSGRDGECLELFSVFKCCHRFTNQTSRIVNQANNALVCRLWPWAKRVQSHLLVPIECVLNLVQHRLANYVYLVPYSTTLLLYIKICFTVSLTVFIMGTMICKAICKDAIRQRLKAASVYSESLGLGSCYRIQAVSRATHSLLASIQYVGVNPSSY